MLSWLIGLVPLYKVLAAFVIMLAGIRYRLGLALSIFLGSLLVALFFGMPPGLYLRTAVASLTDHKTVALSLLVVLILVLSDLMESTGQAGRLMAALSRYLRHPRLRLAFFPALIGFLPMPGGAVFSAPMVKTVSEGFDISAEDKSLVNYWFRHIWETVWPLYPGVILSASLAHMQIGTLVSHTWPATLVCLALGWVFFLRPAALPLRPLAAVNAPVAAEPVSGLRTLALSLPLLFAIMGSLVLEWVLGAVAPGMDFEYGIAAALALAIICVALQNRLAPGAVFRAFLSRSLLKMLLVICAIFIFKDTIAASGVVRQLAEMAGGATALFVAAVFLPFLCGVISGITMAFVGATFPLLLGLLGVLGMDDKTVPYVILALYSGFAGVLVSPLHICFILSCEYFHAELAPCWRRVVLPVALFMTFAVAYFLFLL